MRTAILTLIIQTAAICAAFGNHLNNVTTSQQGDLHQAQQIMQNQHPAFEENKGQVTGEDAEKVKFTYRERGLSIFLLQNGLAYQFSKTHYPADYAQLDNFTNPEERAKMDALRKDIRTETYRMDICLVGANLQPHITTEGKSNDYTHYYNHDALEVHHYSKVTYHNVYPHIDWVIYSKDGQVKYDFVVHPGGNPAHIKLQTQWVENLTLNADGSLSLHNRMGSITEQKPISFQGSKTIKTQFNLVNNQITFTVEPYNPNETLIIDPALQWATYYGGNAWDFGTSCAVDGEGNVYLAGWTDSTTSIASGGHQNTFGGVEDAFLVKFNSGGARQWATYYGGSNQDSGLSCAVSLSGDVYLCGSTASTSAIAASGHQNSYGGGFIDAFLVKFDSSGNRLWATYYGGTDLDEGSSCALDEDGNVYLSGETRSTTEISSGGHQNTIGGANDAFLVKFNSNGTRQWATYYGGSNVERVYSCAADSFGDVYLSGSTSSTSSIASGGHQNTYGGGNYDAFLAKFDSSGVRQWASYYGGSSFDDGACSVDALGNVYLAGNTGSLSSISEGGHQNTYGGGVRDAFLVKFNGSGARQWATYCGGSERDGSLSCAVDLSGNIYLTGQTFSTSSIASGGLQNTYGGNGDGFLVKFNSDGIRQWGTYYGSITDDTGSFCAVDNLGNVLFGGVTTSVSSIAFEGHQNTFGDGLFDAFLAKIDENLTCTPTISIMSNQSGAICLGTSIEFAATITDGGTNITYQWQRNGSNVGTNANTYTSSDNANGDVITCILTCNATCASPTQVTSAGITLTVNPPVTPSVSISANASIVCEGSITLVATVTNGGTNPTYQWQRNGSNVGTNSNTYTSSAIATGDVVTCILTSNAPCAILPQVTSEGIMMTVNPLPAVSITVIGENLEATAGYSSYTWYINEVEIAGATDNILEPLEDGTYEVEVTDENGCTNTAAIDFTINNTSEQSFLSDIALYPNPSNGNFTITLSDGAPRNMQVFDGYGKMVFQSTINSSKEQINVQGLARGVYYVKIMEGHGYTVKSLLIFN